MKGPASKLIRKETEESMLRFFGKEIGKYELRPYDQTVESLFKATTDVNDFAIGGFSRAVTELPREALESSPSAIRNIELKESQILSGLNAAIDGGSNALDTGGNAQNLGERQAKKDNEIIHGRVKAGLEMESAGISKEVRNQLKDAALARIRQQTILQYIESGAGMGKADYEQAYNDLDYYSTKNYFMGEDVLDNDKREIIKRTNELHQKFMSDPEYLKLYDRSIKPLVRRAKLDPKNLPNELFRSHGKGFISHIYGGILPLEKDLQNLAIAPEYYELYQKGGQVDYNKLKGVTIGGKRPIKNSRVQLLNKIGNAEYGPYLKRLIDVLNNAVEEDSGLADFKIGISSFDDLKTENRYLTIELQHVNRLRAEVLQIPLETNGYIPAASPLKERRLSRFFDVQTVYGANEKSNLLRAGQFTLHELANFFQSNALRGGIGSWKDTPHEFLRNARRIPSRISMRLAPETGAIRDWNFLLSITDPYMPDLIDPSQGTSAELRKGYQAFSQNMAHMKRIANSDEKAVAIVIDLESLSNTKTGPTFQANREDTQFVKAGIAAVDIKTKTSIDGTEIASSHGYHYFKRKGFSSGLKDWLRSVLPDGHKLPDELIESAYARYLKQIGATDFKGNKEFFTAVKNNISAMKEAVRRKFRGEDVNFYYITKNGNPFDISAMQYFLPGDEVVKEITDMHIDIQATAGVMKRGYHTPGSLSAERMLQSLLRGVGEENLASQITRGHTMSPKQRKGLANKILRAFSKRGTAGPGPLANLLNIPEEQLARFDRLGVIEGLHASPLLDALGTFGFFSSQYELLKKNPMWDRATGYIGRYLRSRNAVDSTRNIIDFLIRMTNKTYEGYGVPSVNMMSHGGVSHLIVSLFDAAHVEIFPDNPPNRQWNQRFAQSWYVQPSASWLTQHPNIKTTDLAFKRRFGLPIAATDALNEFALQGLPKATDAATSYSRMIMMKGVYSLNFLRGGEDAGMTLVRDTELDTFNLTKFETIHLDPTVDNDALLSDRARGLLKAEVQYIEKKWGKGASNSATQAQWAEAAATVRSNEVITLSEEIVGANKFREFGYGKKAVHGRILSVMPGSDVGQIKIQMEMVMSGREAANNAAQSRLTGGKSTIQIAKTFADGSAEGLPNGYGFRASNSFLSKNFVGASKQVFLNAVLDSFRDMYHDPDIPRSQKITIEKTFRELAAKLKGHANLTDFRIEVSRGDVNMLDHQMRAFGDINLQISDITEAARKGGKVWTAKDIREIEANPGMGSALRWARDGVERQLDKMRKEIEQNRGALIGLDAAASRRAISNVEELLRMFSPKERDAKLVVIGKMRTPIGSPAAYEAFFEAGRDPFSLYGLQGAVGKIQNKIRVEYLLPQHMDKSLIGESAYTWLQDYTMHKLSRAHNSALKTMRNFSEVLLGRNLPKGLDANQLNVLLNRENLLSGQSAKNRQPDFTRMSEKKLLDIQRNVLDLIEVADLEGNTAQKNEFVKVSEAISDALDNKGAQKFATKIIRSPKFFSYKDVEAWSSYAKDNNGILAMLLPNLSSNQALEVDIKKEIERIYSMPGAPTLTKFDLNQRADPLIRALREAKKKAGKHAPFDITEDGIVKFGNAMFMPFDSYADNTFNKLGPDMYLATHETGIKLGLAKAVAGLWDAVGDGNPQDVRDQLRFVSKEWVRSMLLSMGMDKNSKLWNSLQIDAPGYMLKHQNISEIKFAAEQLLQDVQKGFGPKELEGVPYIESALRNLINADFTTQAVTEDTFLKWSAPDATRLYSPNKPVRFAGLSEVRYAEYLEETLGWDMARQVRKGQTYLPGGVFSAHPNPQSGAHGLLTQQTLVIPRELKDYLHMNDNSGYVHEWLYSPLQGRDSDGDQYITHQLEIRSIEHMKQLEAERRAAAWHISQTPEVLSKVYKSQITMGPNGLRKIPVNEGNSILQWSNNGKALISHIEFDKNNQLVNRIMWVQEAELDWSSDFPEAIEQLAKSWARNVPGYNGPQDFMNTDFGKGFMPAAAKKMIPAATNLLKKRRYQLAIGSEAGLIPGGTKGFNEFLGGIKSQLTGTIGQIPIDLAKHRTPDEIAPVMNMLKFWSDTNRYSQYADSVFEKWYEADQSVSVQPVMREASRAKFDTVVQFYRNMDAIESVNPTLAALQRSTLNVSMGRRNSTAWDLMAAQWVDPTEVIVNGLRNHMRSLTDSAKGRLARGMADGSDVIMRKGGKYAAIGAAIMLATTFFKPFSPSNSISPLDGFVKLGDINSEHNMLQADMELPRGVPLDMVNASFGYTANIKMNDQAPRQKRGISMALTSLLRSTKLNQPYDFYKVPAEPTYSYANYTTSVPYMGTSDLERRSNL